MFYQTTLPHRGALQITGKDRGAFLQGVITNDVNKVTPTRAIYAALLSPQGKFQYDFFVVAASVNGEDAWLVDCDGNRADDLLKRLSAYKLRSDVTLENRSGHFQVSVSWGSRTLYQLDSSSQPGVARMAGEGAMFVDPRLGELGVRAILPEGGAQGFLADQGGKRVSPEEYDLHRLKLGAPDGERDVLVNRGILLECGFDELNAIDWNKGCYMGQELTARTRYRGLIRKRLIPVRIQGEEPAFQSPVLQGDREVGDMRTAVKGWGMAMIRLEALSNTLPFSCGNATLTPHIPHWMRLPSLTD